MYCQAVKYYRAASNDWASAHMMMHTIQRKRDTAYNSPKQMFWHCSDTVLALF
jgi:hypothetical protein